MSSILIQAIAGVIGEKPEDFKKDLPVIKTCGCGQVFHAIPEDAKISTDPAFGGAYWDCVCLSTLFLPAKKMKEAS